MTSSLKVKKQLSPVVVEKSTSKFYLPQQLNNYSPIHKRSIISDEQLKQSPCSQDEQRINKKEGSSNHKRASFSYDTSKGKLAIVGAPPYINTDHHGDGHHVQQTDMQRILIRNSLNKLYTHTNQNKNDQHHQQQQHVQQIQQSEFILNKHNVNISGYLRNNSTAQFHGQSVKNFGIAKTCSKPTNRGSNEDVDQRNPLTLESVDLTTQHQKSGVGIFIKSGQQFTLKKESIRALAEQLAGSKNFLTTKQDGIATPLLSQATKSGSRFATNSNLAPQSTGLSQLSSSNNPHPYYHHHRDQKSEVTNSQFQLSLSKNSSYKTAGTIATAKTSSMVKIAGLPVTTTDVIQESRDNSCSGKDPLKGKLNKMRDQLYQFKLKQQQSSSIKFSNMLKNHLTQSPYYIPQIHDQQMENFNKQQLKMKSFLGQQPQPEDKARLSTQNMVYQQSKQQLPVHQPQQNQTAKAQIKPYKFQIMPGNNSKLVRRVINQSARSEFWLEIPNQTSSHFQFRWAPVSRQINFERLSYNFFGQATNHFEGHHEVSRKHDLFKNLKNYCEEINENVFSITPLTFSLKISADKTFYSIKQQLQVFKQIFSLLDEFKSVFDPDKAANKAPPVALREEKTVVVGLQQNDSSPNYHSLVESGNVSFISKHKFQKAAKMKLLQQQKRLNPLDGEMPPADDPRSPVSHSVLDSYQRQQALFDPGEYSMPLCHFIGKNVWILKPTSLNRGQGIHVASTFKKIKRLVKDYCRGREIQPAGEHSVAQCSSKAVVTQERGDTLTHHLQQLQGIFDQQEAQSKHHASGSHGHKGQVLKHNTFIIQKYIERPLLINKRKFDIRVWVLVTQEQEVFFFKEGYLRTSSSEYNTDKTNLNNDYIHLTNNAVQKNAPNYGNFEDGNQLSFQYFKDYISQHYPQCANRFEAQILPKMKYYAALAMASAKRKLNPNKRKYCFEIFGYDYIIDSDFNVWLIEVNTNPCIEESSNLLRMLIPRMLDDAFKLTIDQLFPCIRVQEEVRPATDETTTNFCGQRNGSKGRRARKLRELVLGQQQQITQDNEVSESHDEQPFKVEGYADQENMWEKIAILKGANENAQILIPKPSSNKAGRLLNSERIIDIIDMHEMRLVKPEVLEMEKRAQRTFGTGAAATRGT